MTTTESTTKVSARAATVSTGDRTVRREPPRDLLSPSKTQGMMGSEIGSRAEHSTWDLRTRRDARYTHRTATYSATKRFHHPHVLPHPDYELIKADPHISPGTSQVKHCGMKGAIIRPRLARTMFRRPGQRLKAAGYRIYILAFAPEQPGR